MKKLGIAILSLGLLFSCENNEKQVIELQQANDSLRQMTEVRDSALNDFFGAMNEIEANLETIKEKEKILTLSQSGEMSESQKDRINNDILKIYELLEENRTELDQMQKKLKKSNIRVYELQKMVKKLGIELSEKNAEIDALRNELAVKNIIIDSLFTNIGVIKQEGIRKDSIIGQQTGELNKAFYTIGTKKELTESGVLSKKGGFIGIGSTRQLDADFNKEHFTEVDIRNLKSIPLLAKKAEIVTTHPKTSYTLHGEESADSITVDNYKEFWGVSKYLVVVVEQ